MISCVIVVLGLAGPTSAGQPNQTCTSCIVTSGWTLVMATEECVNCVATHKQSSLARTALRCATVVVSYL